MIRRKFERGVGRPKKCFFCQKKEEPVYKTPQILQQFITERGKIIPRLRTGTCSKHQRRLTIAVKRARHLALLPFIARIR